jgi:hypothetical protein
MMAAMGAALMHDPEVFRALIEMVTCLALPEEIFARPGFADRVAAYMGEPVMTMPGPSRTELLALLN